MSDVCFELKILAQKLLEFKKKHKLSYQKMGDAIGIDKSYLSRIATLDTYPSLPMLSRIAEYMGVPTYTLLIPTDDDIKKEYAEQVVEKMTELAISPEQLHEKTGIAILRLNDILQGIVFPDDEEFGLINSTLELQTLDQQEVRLRVLESIINGLDMQGEQRGNILRYLKENI